MAITYEFWTNLLSYYIDCQHRENSGKLSLPLSALNNSFFTPFESESLFSEQATKLEINLANQNALRDFLAQPKVNSPQYYYGFPLLYYNSISENGIPQKAVSPVFYSQVELKLVANVVVIELMDIVPSVNESLFNYFGLRLEDIEIFNSIFTGTFSDSINNGNQNTWLTDSMEMLKEITGKGFLNNLFDTKNLLHISQTFRSDEDLFINDAILFTAEKSAFNSSLIRELERLKNKEYYNKLEGTALHNLLERTSQVKKANPQILVISEINKSQSEAVSQALSGEITIVGGPPGTGKSQVVLNTIASLFANNLTGMLVSKTNSAVDIITDYFENNFDLPVLLRTGNKSIREKAVDILKQTANQLYKKPNAIQNEEAARHNYEQLFDSVFKEKLNLMEQYQKADEMAVLTEKYQKLYNQAIQKTKDWCKQATFTSYEVQEYQDRIQDLKIHLNDLMLASRKSLLGKIFTKIKNFFQGKTRTDLIINFNKLIDQVKFSIPLLHNANLENIEQEIVKHINALNFLFCYRRLEELNKEIKNLPSIKDFVEQYSKNEKEIISAGRELLSAIRYQQFSSLKFSEIKKFNDFVDAQERLLQFNRATYPSLKKIEEETFPMAQKYFPFTIATSLSAASSMCPLQAGIFDLLIIDEASQCDIASMIPLFYRAKRACIIGDSNQFSHIVTFSQKLDSNLFLKQGLSDADHFYYSYRENSIYDLAKRAVASPESIIFLDEHYRSHPHIINFSNENFYNRNLKIFTNPEKLAFDPGKVAVEWQDVTGKVTYAKSGSAFNKPEAQSVVELTISLMKSFFQQQIFVSIGVVTPLRPHLEEIRSVFQNTVRKMNPDERPIINIYTNHKVPFIIDTAYKFQGNERDIMILSLVASQGIKPGTYDFINERRQLNVALTRARAKLYIVGDKKYCFDNGGYLSKLAAYCDRLIKPSVSSEGVTFASPLEEKLFNSMIAADLSPIPQYQELGFSLDFAIITEDKRIAIECNGISFHTSAQGTSKKTDMIRSQKLANAGWTVLIFWSWDILQNTDKCIQEIQDALK